MIFEDLGERIAISLPCKLQQAGLDLHVTTTSLSLTDKEGASILDVPQLFGTVDAARSELLADGHTVRILLTKLESSLAWTAVSATKDAGEDSALPTPDGEQQNALAARETVKELFTAALHGEVDELARLEPSVSKEGLAGVRDANGRTALHFAAQGGHCAALEYLLGSSGLAVDVHDESGETALGLAAGANNIDAVRLLLNKGASARTPASPKPQPLHRAAATGSEGVVSLLLEAGAQIEAPTEAGTPLLWAAGSGNAEAIRCLLDAGANPNACSEDGVSAMLMAAASGDTEVVAALAAHGADASLPATGGVTALHAAAEGGDLATVRALLQAGANPDAEDAGGGAKPIHAAASASHRHVVEHLLPLTKPRDGQAWTTDRLLADCGSLAATPATASHKGPVIPETEAPDAEAAAACKRAGDQAFVARDFDAAATSYTASLRHDAANHIVWANRSAANLQRGAAQEALDDANLARTLDPSYMKAWYREGEAARTLHKYEDAAQAYFQAFSLDPNNAQLARAFQSAVAQAKQQHVEGQRTES